MSAACVVAPGATKTARFTLILLRTLIPNLSFQGTRFGAWRILGRLPFRNR